jgi:nitroreductase
MANQNAAPEDGMTFAELLENQRSIRRYQDCPVSIQVVQEMIHESTLAPSAGNEQPWKFVVVHDQEMIRKL